VGLAELPRVQDEVVGGCEGGPDRRSTRVQNRSIGIAIDAVVLEIFVDADVELVAVPVVGSSENKRISLKPRVRRCAIFSFPGVAGMPIMLVLPKINVSR
jgi:hypothetical protein